jgi:thymidylate kinase
MTNRSTPVIEFVGAAGVGKSFFSDRLAESLKAKGRRVVALRVVAAEMGLKNIVKATATAAYVVFLVRPILVMTYRRSMKKLAKYILLSRTCRDGAGMHLFDEGIFHRIRGLHRRCPNRSMEEVADIIFRFIDPPDVVVVLVAAPAAIYKMRLERNRRRDVFSLANVENDVQLTEASVKVIEHIQRTAAPAMKVICVNVEADSELVTQEISAVLENILPPR